MGKKIKKPTKYDETENSEESKLKQWFQQLYAYGCSSTIKFIDEAKFVSAPDNIKKINEELYDDRETHTQCIMLNLFLVYSDISKWKSYETFQSKKQLNLYKKWLKECVDTYETDKYKKLQQNSEQSKSNISKDLVDQIDRIKPAPAALPKKSLKTIKNGLVYFASNMNAHSTPNHKICNTKNNFENFSEPGPSNVNNMKRTQKLFKGKENKNQRNTHNTSKIEEDYHETRWNYSTDNSNVSWNATSIKEIENMHEISDPWKTVTEKNKDSTGLRIKNKIKPNTQNSIQRQENEKQNLNPLSNVPVNTTETAEQAKRKNIIILQNITICKPKKIESKREPDHECADEVAMNLNLDEEITVNKDIKRNRQKPISMKNNKEAIDEKPITRNPPKVLIEDKMRITRSRKRKLEVEPIMEKVCTEPMNATNANDLIQDKKKKTRGRKKKQKVDLIKDVDFKELINEKAITGSITASGLVKEEKKKTTDRKKYKQEHCTEPMTTRVGKRKPKVEPLKKEDCTEPMYEEANSRTIANGLIKYKKKQTRDKTTKVEPNKEKNFTDDLKHDLKKFEVYVLLEKLDLEAIRIKTTKRTKQLDSSKKAVKKLPKPIKAMKIAKKKLRNSKNISMMVHRLTFTNKRNTKINIGNLTPTLKIATCSEASDSTEGTQRKRSRKLFSQEDYLQSEEFSAFEKTEQF